MLPWKPRLAVWEEFQEHYKFCGQVINSMERRKATKARNAIFFIQWRPFVTFGKIDLVEGVVTG